MSPGICLAGPLAAFMSLVQFADAVLMDKVNLTASFDYPTNTTKDLILNCSLRTNGTIQGWRWEEQLNREKWNSPEGDIIKSDVIQYAKSRYRLFSRWRYNTLHHALLPTYVNQTFRCFVVTAEGPQKMIAAYYVVPLSELPVDIYKRQFQVEDVGSHTSSKRNSSSRTTVIAAVSAVLGVAAVVAIALAAVAYKNRTEMTTENKRKGWEKDALNKLDGVSKPLKVVIEDKDQEDKLSQVSSTMASAASSSVASSAATSTTETKLIQGMGHTQGTGLGIMMSGDDIASDTGDSTLSLAGSNLMSETGAPESEIDVGSSVAGSEAEIDVKDKPVSGGLASAGSGYQPGGEDEDAATDVASQVSGVAGSGAGSEVKDD